MRDSDKVKKLVKDKYGQIARGEISSCSPKGSSCCGDNGEDIVNLSHGYSRAELDKLPEGSELGLGCGNPLSLIEIQTGWKVLDLGSGAGVDVFLAAEKVGDKGEAVGLDMTDDMLAKARANAENGGYRNVKFKKGEIDSMPFADKSFDLVISNCVINLVPDKKLAYEEIFRVLKPGGRFAISDIATRGELPQDIRESAEAWAGCVAGALELGDYLELLKQVGFADVEVRQKQEYDYCRTEEHAILSVGIVGQRPA